MQIKLRPVNVKDAPVLAMILIRSNEVFRGHVPDSCLDFPEEESAQNWYKLLNQGLDKHEFMLMAVDQNDEKAVCYCWGCPTSNESEFGGELKQIAILPEYQRRDIGRLMIKAVAQKLMA